MSSCVLWYFVCEDIGTESNFLSFNGQKEPGRELVMREGTNYVFVKRSDWCRIRTKDGLKGDKMGYEVGATLETLVSLYYRKVSRDGNNHEQGRRNLQKSTGKEGCRL